MKAVKKTKRWASTLQYRNAAAKGNSPLWLEINECQEKNNNKQVQFSLASIRFGPERIAQTAQLAGLGRNTGQVLTLTCRSLKLVFTEMHSLFVLFDFCRLLFFFYFIFIFLLPFTSFIVSASQQKCLFYMFAYYPHDFGIIHHNHHRHHQILIFHCMFKYL